MTDPFWVQSFTPPDSWNPLWRAVIQFWQGTQVDFILHTEIDPSDHYVI